jgi:PhnB protein
MKKATPQYASLVPYLGVKNAAKAIEFYKKILGAKERFRLTSPESGKVAHSELEINGSLFMLAEEFPGYSKSPKTLGGTPVRFALTVKDTDTTVKKAKKAGAAILHAPADQFYGMRSATIRDPFGHEWLVQHPIEKVAYAKMKTRFVEMCKKGGM